MNAVQPLGSPCIDVTPKIALIDRPISITLSGFASNISLTLHAKTEDDAMQVWESWATFLSDTEGNVDVNTQQPHSGSYQQADGMGLLWSMTRRSKARKHHTSSHFVKTQLSRSTSVIITAEVEGTIVTRALVERVHIASGVTQQELHEQGLIGTLFLPSDTAPRPAVLIVGGSDGLPCLRAAALLASSGYVALALTYFFAPSLPATLARIPLEYFKQAIHWIEQHPRVQKSKIGVLGGSRGGELALLLGSLFPQIAAVVATAPSSLTNQSVSTFSPQAAWTYQGIPFPYVVSRPNLSDLLYLLKCILLHRPVSFKRVSQKTLRPSQAREQAAISVEKIQGPLLLISGADDQVWPSSIYAERIVSRLVEYHFPYFYQHLSYPSTGHVVGLPYGFPFLPPLIEAEVVGPLLLAVGGKKQESAFADIDSWRQVKRFLGEYLERVL